MDREHKTWLDRILEEEGTAENEIAVCMLNYGFLPFSNSENESEAVLKDQIRKYKPLLELWKKMDGMVTIDLIPNRETTFEVVLVPADSFVSGFVVGYNERFKVVQYLGPWRIHGAMGRSIPKRQVYSDKGIVHDGGRRKRYGPDRIAP